MPPSLPLPPQVISPPILRTASSFRPMPVAPPPLQPITSTVVSRRLSYPARSRRPPVTSSLFPYHHCLSFPLVDPSSSSGQHPPPPLSPASTSPLRPRAFHLRATQSPTCSDHMSFIKDIASAKPPELLPFLLDLLQAQGANIVSPADRKGIFPFAIPLCEKPTGTLTALLRWPTAPSGMEMPVVQVHKNGVRLLAKTVDQYVHRILVEEDAAHSLEGSDKLWNASSGAAQNIYRKGDFAESGIADLDSYILKKVGLFPDIIERRAARHLENDDQVSALIIGEFYTKNHFPGFARPFVFNAQILLKVGRSLEAKDAARGALKSPWWTLGCRYHEVAEIAEWDDEQIEFIKEKVSEEGKQEDLKKGKAPEQVVLDEAAFLLDLASIDGTWSDVCERISQCYAEAGLGEIARFVLCRD